MRLFDTWKLTAVLFRIETARREGIKYEIENGHRDESVSGEFKKTWVDELLQEVRELAEKGELEATKSRVNPNGGLSSSLDYGLTYQELDYELKVLRESIQMDLSDKFVYIVEGEKYKYNTKDFLLEKWGKSGFYFPSIRKDSPALMRAYVHGLNTACVFHLMRITEIGLRALARRMRVRLPRNKQLEWAQWNEIIIEMSKKTDLIANRKASSARDELLEFYRGSIGEFQGFKDAYRNFIMHMREKIDYDENEARSLIERVSHFLGRLSDKIDEQGRVLTEKRREKMFAEINAQIEEEKRKADDQTKQGIRELQQNDAAIGASSTRKTESSSGGGEAGENKKAEV